MLRVTYMQAIAAANMVFHRLSQPQRHLLKRLHIRNVPPVLLQLVALCLLAGLVDDKPGLDAVEFFAGQQSVTNAFCTRGYNAISFEMLYDPVCEDILSRSGFAYAISLVMRLEPGAVVWFPV